MAATSNNQYAEYAEFYDLYVGTWMKDLPYYLRWSEKVGKSILEIGAGTGRLTVPLAQHGCRVTAVDISPEMLARLRARLMQEPSEVASRVEWVEADAGELSLHKQFKLILFPFYTFNYLLSEASQRRALASAKGHLLDEGRLIVDVFVPWARLKNCPAEPVLKVDRVDSSTGVSTQVWVQYSIDPINKIEERRHIVKGSSSSGEKQESEFVTVRKFWFPGELHQLFENSGFSVEHANTDYCDSVATDSSENVQFVLRKA